MIIKSLKVNNLQLFKSAELSFDKINIFSGKNLDNPGESGNASGKTTIALTPILFALYGYTTEGTLLKDLIRFDEKETTVELEIEKDNKLFRIVRKVPTSLQIFQDGKELEFNTPTIAQRFIDETFGNKDFFRQYRCCDSKNGIDVLSLGIVSLRKTLMQFIEDIFTQVRNKLLAQKNEREKYSVDKKLYKHYLSTKRKEILEKGIKELQDNGKELRNLGKEAQGTISKVNGEISAKQRIVSYKESEIKKAEAGICPILKSSCDRIGKKLTAADKEKSLQEMKQLNTEIASLKESITADQDYLEDLEMQRQELDYKIENARKKLMRLESAFQFKDYKYTKADIIIYDEAIKVLDTFAGVYIQQWLSSLTTIINNLLKSINISVEFTNDKSFLNVYDNGQILKYDLLSTGQKIFLGVIFKLAILLEKNLSGIVIMDDGLNDLDYINFDYLVEIIRTLPFQAFMVYQGYQDELEGIKHFTSIREKGKSKIHV